MTDERGWGLSEQHLLPDAVVAFVDGELSPTAHDRAAAHMARCPHCLAEIIAQRQAASAVQSADAPVVPAGLLATLRAIPQQVSMPAAPDGLAVSDDGQLVVVQKPEQMQAAASAPFGSSAPLGSSTKLGEGDAVLGRRSGRRAAQGAGVVVSGLVLGALALVTTSSGSDEPKPQAPPDANRPAVAGVDSVQQAGFVTLRTAGR